MGPFGGGAGAVPVSVGERTSGGNRMELLPTGPLAQGAGGPLARASVLGKDPALLVDIGGMPMSGRGAPCSPGVLVGSTDILLLALGGPGTPQGLEVAMAGG